MTAMSLGFVIDDKGRAWPEASPGLARRLGGAVTGYVAAHAVRERGFIHVQPQQGATRVALRAGRFSAAALARLLYLLRDRPPRHVLLAVLNDDDWSYDMFVSLWELADRLEGLVAGAPSSPRARWVALERDLTSLATRSFARVRPMIELWRARRGQLDEGVFAAVEALGMRDRALLARRLPDSSHLVFEHFGAGISVLTPCESLFAVGRDVEALPDRPYGAWIAQVYRDALVRSVPRFHSVCATIETSRAESMRARYDRLLLPWRDRLGADIVLALSVRISAFYRPRMPAAAAAQ
jgi:hypothetical protein